MLEERIEKVTAGFGLGLIQDVVTLIDLLTQHDINIKDLRDYVELKKERGQEEREKERVETFNRQEREQKLWGVVAPKCPDCGDVLVRPKRLCGKKISTNIEGWSCLWYCIRGWNEDKPSGICGWERYTHENAKEITGNLMRGKLDGYNIP